MSLVPTVRTTPAPSEFLAALRAAWPEVTRRQAAIVAALWDGETKGGANCFNWNIGNVKCPKSVAMGGADYMYLRGTWEGINPADVARVLASAPPGQISLETLEWRIKAVHPKTCVRFDPPHPQCWFRSFPSLDTGVAHHLAFMRSRYAAAWAAIEAGDPKKVSEPMRHYYTVSVAAHRASLVKLFDKWMAIDWSEELSCPATLPEGMYSPGGFAFVSLPDGADLICPRGWMEEEPEQDVEGEA